jgi:predicted alpha/beta hydrolase family esterase
MRELKDFSVLILPGLGGAGEDHWQTHWERAFPDFVRVQQADWENVAYDEWAPRLTAAVSQAPRPVVLIAHSLGTSLTMKWSFDQPAAAGKVAGAFLVAPSDRDRFRVQNRPEPRGFGSMILKRLPFPSMVVASGNDDRVSFDRAQEFAKAWGSTLTDAGNLGHIGSAAKLGLWPAGLVWLGQFLATLETSRKSKVGSRK